MKKYIRKNISFFISVCLLLAILVSMIAGPSGIVVRAEAFGIAGELEVTERSTELLETELSEVELSELESADTEFADTESVDAESETILLEFGESEFTEPETAESEMIEAEDTGADHTEQESVASDVPGTEDLEQEISISEETATEILELEATEFADIAATEAIEIGVTECIEETDDNFEKIYLVGSVLNGNSSTEADEDDTIVVSDEDGISTISEEVGISVASDESGILTASAATEVSGTLNLGSYSSGGSIILTGDTTASGICQLSSGSELTIDLNGYTLTMNSGSYFMLMGGTLNIQDSSTEQTGVIYLSTYLVWFYMGGTFNLYSGTIDGSTQTSKPTQGGAVFMQANNQAQVDSVFNMYGGTIQYCSSTTQGGAVYVGNTSTSHTSTFNMSGGTIQGCSSQYGGAIYIDGGNAADGNGTVNLLGYVTITDNTASPEGSAIYNYGTLNIEGYLDINGTVFLRNEWEGTGQHFINVTGPLCVLGDGYIDVDTTYWYTGYEAYYGNNGSGYTVVHNASGGTVSDEKFYYYAAYFYNASHSLGVGAGYATVTTPWTATNHTLVYVDVMGNTLSVAGSSTSTAGTYTPSYQSKEYLIYVEGVSTSTYYYSIKMLKYNLDGSSLLDDAVFTLYQADSNGSITLSVDGTDVTVSEITTCTIGDIVEVGTGVAYFMDTNGTTSKLMLTDGTYYIVETTAPTDASGTGTEYAEISSVVTITISGSTVTVSGVGTESNSGYYTYSLTTQSNEIVLTAYDPEKSTQQEPVTVTLTGIKYGTSVVDGNQLAGAVYKVYASDDTTYTTPLGTATSADGTGSERKGALTFLDTSGNTLTLTAGSTYILHEVTAPAGYVTGEDITIAISEDGSTVTLTQGGDTLSLYDESSIPSGTEATEGVSYYTWNTETNTLTLYLTDETLYSLPGTNGAGIYRGTAMGILLMCLTGLGILCLRKKQRDLKNKMKRSKKR